MNKTQKHLENIILRQREDIELLHNQLDIEAGLVEMLEKQADHDEGLHKRLIADEKARRAAEKKAATEAATLKSIANGLIPVEELRALVSHHGVGIVVPGEEIPSVDLEWPVKSTLVQKAILAALLEKPAKYTYAAGGFTNPSPFSPFQPGDRVRVSPADTSFGSGWFVRGVA